MKKSIILSMSVAAALSAGSAFGQQGSKTSTQMGFQSVPQQGSNAATNTGAQATGNIDPSNAQAVAARKDIMAGHFLVDRQAKGNGVVERVNVNYEITGAPFTKSMHVDLNTPNPVHFSIDIADANGKKQLHWVSKQASHSHIENIDISKLAAGSYTLNIYYANDPKPAQSLAFTKAVAAKVLRSGKAVTATKTN